MRSGRQAAEHGCPQPRVRSCARVVDATEHRAKLRKPSEKSQVSFVELAVPL
jgi:hypothetical protein